MKTHLCHKPVNVSSVPQRSPFRYPGGKTWLVPLVRRWMRNQKEKPELFIEPFAGGGIIGLTVAFEQLADKVILVELDDNVAAVWRTILGNHAEWLALRILDFEITVDNVKRELEQAPKSVRQQAFCTILRNRTFHGGIMAKGSRMTKRGEAGKGISSRWYPETLARRIRNIHKIRRNITFIQGDGMSIIENHIDSPDSALFVDPPYTASKKGAGSRLYTHSEIDHEQLFNLMHEVKGNFLMTYDNDEIVKKMSEENGFNFDTIPMQSRRSTIMYELIITNRPLPKMPEPAQNQQLLFEVGQTT